MAYGRIRPIGRLRVKNKMMLKLQIYFLIFAENECFYRQFQNKSRRSEIEEFSNFSEPI